MLSSFLRPLAAVSLGLVAGVSLAQTPPTLREAVDAAWALSAPARSAASRAQELQARERATASPFAGPPTVSASHRTDRVGSNHGLRESELELSAPLWDRSLRRAAAGQVQADRAALEEEQVLARSRLAADVREAAAQATLAQVEREVARAKVREAQALAQDVERRVRAGESARVDLLQALAVLRQASAAEALAESALARSAAQWRALTGLGQLPELDELDERAGEPQEAPALRATRAQLQAAEARLAVARADRGDPTELGIGVVRERAAFGTGGETSLRLAVRVPLGGGARSQARIAAAQAEVDAARAQADAALRTADAEAQATRAELEAARRAEVLAADRDRAAREVQALIARAYQLGESDLPTRLRAEAERFEAELAHARARLETRRAAAKVNQAYGLLP
jgi:cobalt-zinc-cadmium efflux system outer membrane protein